MEIIRDTIGEAHDEVIRCIIEEGTEKKIETEPGVWSQTWEYPDAVTIIVRHPLREPIQSKASKFGPKFIEEYKKELITLTPPREDGKGFVYTYGNLLFDYPILDNIIGGKDSSSRLLSETERGKPIYGWGLGDGKGFNQMKELVRRLIENQESRRANAITWVPQIHTQVFMDQPCLQFTHFLIRHGIAVYGEDPSMPFLHLRAPFRSHCMASGYGPNAIALGGLMEYIANEINSYRSEWNVQVGSLTTFSSSAHIYPTDQWDIIRRFKEVLRLS